MEIKAPVKLGKDDLNGFERLLWNALNSADEEILLDMSETNYISFAALLFIHKTHLELKDKRRMLILKNVTDILSEVMEVTGFGSMLIIR